MTKQIIIFLLCVFSITSVQSQELSRYKCAYETTALADTVTSKSFPKDTYILQINDNITKGFYYRSFHRDSLYSANYELYHQIRMQTIRKTYDLITQGDPKAYEKTLHLFLPGFLFQSTLYKDYNKNEMILIDRLNLEDDFVFRDELKTQDWEISPDTMTICGYHSQKATCNYRGRDWIAWFTSEIPISEGPWKFYGLPGLITKIADSKGHYSFVLTGFQEIEEPITTRISPKAEEIERKKFIYLLMDGRLRIAMAEQSAEVIGLSNTNTSVNKNRGNRIKYDYIERDYKE